MSLLLFLHHSAPAECLKPRAAKSVAAAESGQKVAPFRRIKIIGHRYFSPENNHVVTTLVITTWRSSDYFAAAACLTPKTVFQSLLMFTTVKPYFFAALSDALSFSP
jgi:hypothetical protein